MSVSGKVKSWDLAKGFGFVSSNDGTDAFVHTTALNGGVLVVGEAVKYDTEEVTRKGAKAFKAINITGPGLKPRSKTEGTKTGTIKTWDATRSYGFIKFGEDDVYVHSSAFGGGNLKVGSEVTFDTEDVGHRSGRKVATNVRGPAVIGVGKLKGTVKAWIPLRGFGFIEPEGGGDKVYVHCSTISDGILLEGKQVFYDLGKDNRKGKSEDEARTVATNVSGPAVRPGLQLPPVMFVGRGRALGRGGRGRAGRGGKK
eukprot:TRINITY_DN17521_c0_g1_i1.p1 TRINITY_DN17521_c0_g1~~TRINITY_DN17521_c0_g1_i1.p1  ORF type:complete len:256 (+),score=46.08 TRINITY_DN17521_c0_g1_i1:50-817(+)